MSVLVRKLTYTPGKANPTRETVKPGTVGVKPGDIFEVAFRDDNGKQRTEKIKVTGREGKSMADERRDELAVMLAKGTFEAPSRATWAKFRAEYNKRWLPRYDAKPGTRRIVRETLDRFEQSIKPNKMAGITTATVDAYATARLQQPGKKPGSTLSPATVNKDLRTIEAILNKAHDWGYLNKMPKVVFVREDKDIGRVMTPEHFNAIFDRAGAARAPECAARCKPADWWRALFAVLFTTGWRINAVLSIKWADVDLEAGKVVMRASTAKGRRTVVDYLPEPVIDLLRALDADDEFVFRWPHAEKQLYTEFKRIQRAAEIELPCINARKHQCTDACHLYAFHSFRRGYATENEERLSPDVLQRKMQHKNYTTTQGYIDIGRKMKDAASRVFVPEVISKRKPR